MESSAFIARVWIIQALRSHKPQGMAKKKKKIIFN